MASEQPILMSEQDASALIQAVRAVRGISGSGGIRVYFSGGGISIALGMKKPRRQPPADNGPFTRFTIIDEKEDWIHCRDEEAAALSSDKEFDQKNDVLVDKPSHLKGIISERIVNEGAISQEIQFIYPQYLNPDHVVALPLDSKSGRTDQDGNPLKWIDFNLHNRVWVTKCPTFSE